MHAQGRDLISGSAETLGSLAVKAVETMGALMIAAVAAAGHIVIKTVDAVGDYLTKGGLHMHLSGLGSMLHLDKLNPFKWTLASPAANPYDANFQRVEAKAPEITQKSNVISMPTGQMRDTVLRKAEEAASVQSGGRTTAPMPGLKNQAQQFDAMLQKGGFKALPAGLKWEHMAGSMQDGYQLPKPSPAREMFRIHSVKQARQLAMAS